MVSKGDETQTYDELAPVLVRRYESMTFEMVHHRLVDLVPERPGCVLDIGAGSGRDAAWFAWRGHDVVAVEPSPRMREEAREEHQHAAVRWLDDALPGLPETHRLGLEFDFILLSAVWVHVAPRDRRRAFRKLATLLAPKGRLAITLKHGAPPPAAKAYPVNAGELEDLAVDFGLRLVRHAKRDNDVGQRDGVWWETLVFEFPDDESGALPLLRHVVLLDDKSSTYKIALLRSLARVADSAAGFAREIDEDMIALPLGLVALYWVRMMKPLVEQDYPQAPRNVAGKGLGFVKAGFRDIEPLHPSLLRPGARIDAGLAGALIMALRDAATTIAQMPATYITYPGSSDPIFGTCRQRVRKPRGSLVLDETALLAFGEFRVPATVWRALRRMNVWVEPVLIAEWISLMQTYARGQSRRLTHDPLARALAWIDPERDTRVARDRIRALMNDGRPVHCAWSGNRLRHGDFDVDHCFPFSAWACSDLWNLLPATREVNQRRKRDKMVSVAVLENARERIEDWWSTAWVSSVAENRQFQFFEEARASLPLGNAGRGGASVPDVFDGVRTRRAFLQQTQRLPEWDGT